MPDGRLVHTDERYPGYIWEKNPVRRNREAFPLNEGELIRLERYFHEGRITANAVADLIKTVRVERDRHKIAQRHLAEMRETLARYQRVVDAAGASETLLREALARGGKA